MPRVSQYRLPLINRFESHIISKENCWFTDLTTKRSGYPSISDDNGKMKYASKISYKIYNNPIAEGLIIRHICDNPLCVNPDYLELGTHQDNVNDRNSRNRQAKGEKVHTCKLTEKQVLEIKRLLAKGNYSQRKIAKMFGISQMNICIPSIYRG
jgi:HNH endonuclease